MRTLRTNFTYRIPTNRPIDSTKVAPERRVHGEPAMAHCINRECGLEIRDEYYFCPCCGTDNRAPEKRVRLAEHAHKYPEIGTLYCVWCGEPPDEPYHMKRRTRIGVGKFLLIVGLLVAMFGFTWSLLIPKVGNQLGVKFATWHNEEHRYTVRRSGRNFGDPNDNGERTSTTGQTTAGLVAIGALLVAGVGILMLVKFQFDPNWLLARSTSRWR